MTIATAPPPQHGRGRTTLTLRLGGRVLTALVWIGGAAYIFPLLWTTVSSFRPDTGFMVSPFRIDPHELTLSNYATIFGDGTILTGFKNSAIQVAVVLATTLFFCPLAGYGFAKFAFRGKALLFGLMMLTLFFVPLTQYMPLFLEMNAIGWIDTYQGLVIPLVISSFGVFWMTAVIAGVPDELLQAARVDGCGNFGTWWRIILPVIQPALISLAVVTFLGAYNDYLWPLIILRSSSMETIQVILSLLQTNPKTPAMTFTSNWGPLLAGSSIVLAPTVVLFLMMQRYFLRGVLQGSLKG